MRTFKATLFLAVFLLIGPAPAQAWFGWLDDLSGPGPFWGQQYEVRIACFGGDTDKVTRYLDDLLFTAKLLTLEVVKNDNNSFEKAQKAWGNFAAAIAEAHALSPKDTKEFAAALKKIKAEDFEIDRQGRAK
jgi:ABC-type sugar transport system substrate-binding protein